MWGCHGHGLFVLTADVLWGGTEPSAFQARHGELLLNKLTSGWWLQSHQKTSTTDDLQPCLSYLLGRRASCSPSSSTSLRADGQAVHWGHDKDWLRVGNKSLEGGESCTSETSWAEGAVPSYGCCQIFPQDCYIQHLSEGTILPCWHVESQRKGSQVGHPLGCKLRPLSIAKDLRLGWAAPCGQHGSMSLFQPWNSKTTSVRLAMCLAQLLCMHYRNHTCSS